MSTSSEAKRPNSESSKPRVLFFARRGCEASAKARVHLDGAGFDVDYVESGGRGEKLPEFVYEWRGQYILCFRSLFILPKRVLDNAEIAAINFHPAPTDYPGSGCVNFALYDNARHYGVTAHLMNEKVDNGAILDCRRFPILSSDGIDSLLARSYVKMLDLFLDITTGLAMSGRQFVDACVSASSHERWNGEARKMSDFAKLQSIPLDVDEPELRRLIRATFTPLYPPKVYLHGYEFALTGPTKVL